MREFPRHSVAFAINDDIGAAGRMKKDLAHDALPSLALHIPSL